MKIINIKIPRKLNQIGVNKWKIEYNIDAFGTEEIIADSREEAERIIDEMPTNDMDPEFSWDDFRISRSVQLDNNDDEITNTEEYH